jgi:hypothetical protein
VTGGDYGVDCWRGLYDPFRRYARGHRLVLRHVRLCNNGWDHVAGWHISAGVLSAPTQGKHTASPLGRSGYADARCWPNAVAGSRVMPARRNASVLAQETSGVV